MSSKGKMFSKVQMFSKIKWISVDTDSSMISAMVFVPEKNHLEVIFANNKRYVYENVPDFLFLVLISSESIGRTFNLLIRQNPEDHPYTEA